MRERMVTLASEGFACAQIMMILVLESEDKSDPDLIRTVGALNNGVRDTGNICGAFTGGACMLSYFAGQGERDEVSEPSLDAMTQELYDWFAALARARYGDVTCPAVLEGDATNKLVRCPQLVEETFSKVVELLEREGLL
ncbi:MAG: C-GCAxxG-C-C family protein [Coriobacteriales bacterium]|jgi:C_GCAxxG_C_C family probable redox protein|nr:C-GCAxxG-C-C family protein [Coriobacteriales bacterium]